MHRNSVGEFSNRSHLSTRPALSHPLFLLSIGFLSLNLPSANHKTQNTFLKIFFVQKFFNNFQRYFKSQRLIFSRTPTELARTSAQVPAVGAEQAVVAEEGEQAEQGGQAERRPDQRLTVGRGRALLLGLDALLLLGPAQKAALQGCGESEALSPLHGTTFVCTGGGGNRNRRGKRKTDRNVFWVRRHSGRIG